MSCCEGDEDGTGCTCGNKTRKMTKFEYKGYEVWVEKRKSALGVPEVRVSIYRPDGTFKDVNEAPADRRGDRPGGVDRLIAWAINLIDNGLKAHVLSGNQNTYLIIFPDGKRFEFDYEEMVELMAAGKKSTEGAECLEMMKAKAAVVFDALPQTNY